MKKWKRGIVAISMVLAVGAGIVGCSSAPAASDTCLLYTSKSAVRFGKGLHTIWDGGRVLLCSGSDESVSDDGWMVSKKPADKVL